MRLRAESTDPASVQADVLAVPIYREDKEISGDLAELEPRPAARSAGRSNGASSTSSSTPRPSSTPGRSRPDKLLLQRRRRVVATGARAASRRPPRDDCRVAALQRWPSGCAMARRPTDMQRRHRREQGTYRPYAYYGRVRDTPAMLRSVEEVDADRRRRARLRGARRGVVIAEGVEFGRTLANRACQRPVPGADGRGGPRAGGRWLHGRGARRRPT